MLPGELRREEERIEKRQERKQIASIDQRLQQVRRHSLLKRKLIRFATSKAVNGRDFVSIHDCVLVRYSGLEANNS